MEQVWKCDFCSKTDIENQVIESHEKSCSFNPEVKGCWSCVHHIDEGMPISGPMYVCQVGKSHSEVDEFESKGGCEKWRSEE